MVVETAVAVVFGVCFCLSIIAVAILGLIVRDCFYILHKENSDLKFENELLISEIDKTHEQLEETQKILEELKERNLTYVKQFCGA